MSQLEAMAKELLAQASAVERTDRITADDALVWHENAIRHVAFILTEVMADERERCGKFVDKAAEVWEGPSPEHGDKIRYVTERVSLTLRSLAVMIRKDPFKGDR